MVVELTLIDQQVSMEVVKSSKLARGLFVHLLEGF